MPRTLRPAVARAAGVLSIALLLVTLRPAAARPQTLPQSCIPNGGSSSNMSTENGGLRRWEVHWTGRDCTVDLRAQGRIDFADDFSDVRAITPDGSFDLAIREGDASTRLYVKSNSNGSLSRQFSVNGQSRTWDDAARQWFGTFVIALDRQTAFAVDVRLPRLLAQGGPNAVLDEVDRMTGDYARSTYLMKLIQVTPLDHPQVRRVIALAGSKVRSDYEIAQILVAAATTYGLPDAGVRSDFLRAVAAIKSDYEHNRALHALLDRSQPTEAEAGAILSSVSTIGSDYELSRTLVDLADRKLVTPPLFDQYLDDAARIKSDYERSRSLQALLSSEPTRLSSAQIGTLLSAAATIKSDYEKANVLVKVATTDSSQLTGDLRNRYERAADTIRSDYDRGRALAALPRTAVRH